MSRGDIRSGWNRPSSDFHGGTRAPEAQIRQTFNISNRSEMAMRAKIDSIPNASNDNVIGFGYVGGRYGSIEPKDVIFAERHQHRVGPKTDANMEVFSSFNGEVVPSGITQAEFNRMYKAVGVTQGGSDPEFKHGGDNSGIAGIIQGATTVTNNSETTFFFGDMVRAVPPKVNAKERQKFHSEMKLLIDENFIDGKHKGRLELVSYDGIMGQVEEAVSLAVTEARSLDVPGRAASIQNNTYIEDSDAEGVALCLKRFLSFVALQTMIVVQKSPGLQQAGPLELAARLGLISDPTVQEDVSLQQHLFSRFLVSSLGATNEYDTIATDISQELGVAAVPQVVPLFGSAAAQFTPAEQVQQEGEQAFDLFWRSIAHLLHRQGSDILGQCISTSEPGKPMDINLHAS